MAGSLQERAAREHEERLREEGEAQRARHEAAQAALVVHLVASEQAARELQERLEAEQRAKEQALLAVETAAKTSAAIAASAAVADGAGKAKSDAGGAAKRGGGGKEVVLPPVAVAPVENGGSGSDAGEPDEPPLASQPRLSQLAAPPPAPKAARTGAAPPGAEGTGRKEAGRKEADRRAEGGLEPSKAAAPRQPDSAKAAPQPAPAKPAAGKAQVRDRSEAVPAAAPAVKNGAAKDAAARDAAAAAMPPPKLPMAGQRLKRAPEPPARADAGPVQPAVPRKEAATTHAPHAAPCALPAPVSRFGAAPSGGLRRAHDEFADLTTESGMDSPAHSQDVSVTGFLLKAAKRLKVCCMPARRQQVRR
jgi:hypothetical protein